MRGGKPKPIAKRKMEGNRSKRPLPVEPDLTRATCADIPSFVPEDGKVFWAEKVPLLRAENNMAAVDEPMAVLMAMAYGFAMQAARDLECSGLTETCAQTGITKKNPLAQIFRDNAMLFHQFAAKFGMSPSDRARMLIDAIDRNRDTDDILNGNWSAEKPSIRPN